MIIACQQGPDQLTDAANSVKDLQLKAKEQLNDSSLIWLDEAQSLIEINPERIQGIVNEDSSRS